MREDEILQLPKPLDETTKKLIGRSYIKAIEDIHEEEVLYIESSIAHKLNGARYTGIEWVIRLTDICECIFGVMKKYREKKLTISEGTYKSIGAALFYFINPYDIIPDHIPDIGYIDDYYVVILCLNLICAQDRELILDKLKLL